MATEFQRFAIDHVPFPVGTGGMPLQYDKLKNSGFENIYFRPEEGADIVAQRITYARTQDTFRGKFRGSVWIGDPVSEDSIAAGIPRDPVGWAKWIADFVKKLKARNAEPTILTLNVEASGRGYPSWRAQSVYTPWMKCWMNVTFANGLKEPRLFYTPNGGTSGKNRPNFTISGATDNGIIWLPENSKKYPYSEGWRFNALAANTLRSLLPDQRMMVQPEGRIEDFDYRAWGRIGARISPQIYSSQPYLDLFAMKEEFARIETNRYAKLIYGEKVDPSTIHPTIGAGGAGFYPPTIADARKTYKAFGVTLYRHDYFSDADFKAYRDLVVP